MGKFKVWLKLNLIVGFIRVKFLENVSIFYCLEMLVLCVVDRLCFFEDGLV